MDLSGGIGLTPSAQKVRTYICVLSFLCLSVYVHISYTPSLLGTWEIYSSVRKQ